MTCGKVMQEVTPHAGLFRMAFAFTDLSGEAFELAGMRVEPLDTGTAANPGPGEALSLVDEGTRLRGYFAWRTDLFEEEGVRAAMDGFVGLLARAAADPDARLSALAPGPEADARVDDAELAAV